MKKLSCLLIVFLICMSAWADLVVPDLECWIRVNGDEPFIWNPAGTGNGVEDQFDYDGMTSDSGGMWSATWDITADIDPFISALLSLTNTTSATQTYTFTTLLPVPVFPGPTLAGGSTSISVGDINGDGVGTIAVDTISGQPMYSGFIDMMTATPTLSLTLLPPTISSLSVTQAWETVSHSETVLPPSIAGPGVMMNIAIQHKFTLTPGDQATFNSTFVVIPEPTSICLLALGSLALLKKRRA